MYVTTLDGWYVWLAVSIASLATFGVALGLPAGSGPDAVRLADAVDAVASSPHDAKLSRRVRASAIDLDSQGISLRTEAGTAHATFAYGPVTPVGASDRLRQVLEGRPLRSVFASPRAFARVMRNIRIQDRGWRSAPSELTIRRVHWEGVDATLVGP